MPHFTHYIIAVAKKMMLEPVQVVFVDDFHLNGHGYRELVVAFQRRFPQCESMDEAKAQRVKEELSSLKERADLAKARAHRGEAFRQDSARQLWVRRPVVRVR